MNTPDPGVRAPMPAKPPRQRRSTAAASADLLLTALAAGSLVLTAWSLATLLHGRAGIPWPIAALGIAVFDVPAIAASVLVYMRRGAPHTALGARLVMTADLLASAAVNGAHGAMLGGWTTAAILAAAPLSFEVVFELRHRTLTAAIWFMFRREASDALRRDAWTRIAPTVQAPAPERTATPERTRTAHAVLTERFAAMDPAAAVQIAADAHPKLPPAELAALLADYGVTVDALTVALVLGHTPAQVTIDRVPQPHPAATEPTPELDTAAMMRGDARPDTPQLTAMSKSGAILATARHLGPDASPADIAHHLARHAVPVDTAYVRTVLSRAKNRTQDEPEQPGQMKDGYL